MRTKIVASVMMTAALACAVPARAQLNGENLLGDMGVQSGTQPLPGLYASFIYYRYDAASIRDANGKRVTVDPTGNASQTIDAAVPLFYYVTLKKFLGANFAMMAVIPTATASIEAPGFGLSEKLSFGIGATYIM